MRRITIASIDLVHGLFNPDRRLTLRCTRCGARHVAMYEPRGKARTSPGEMKQYERFLFGTLEEWEAIHHCDGRDSRIH